MKKKLLSTIAFFAFALMSSQTIVYVDINATGSNTGANWANAFTDVQTAISNTPANNAEVWIAAGTYRLSSTSSSFTIPSSKTNFKIYGGFNGTETMLSQRDFRNNLTTLSGDVNGDDGVNFTNRTDNAYSVIIVGGNSTVIDGVTISGGYANGGNGSNKNGAAIRKLQAVANLYVRNCTIEDNLAFQSAAGIAAFTQNSGTIEVSGCIIRNNKASWGTGLYAVAVAGGNITVNVNVYNNLFYNNEAGNITNGSELSYAGSAVWIRAEETNSFVLSKVVNNTFYGNKDFGANAVNALTSVGVEKSTNGFLNSQFVNNISKANVDGLGNPTKNYEAILTQSNANMGSAFLDNNIADVAFTGYPNNVGTNGNSVANPLFIDESNANFRLTINSPAKDFGSTSALPASFTEDLDGNARIVDSAIDAGAYENDGLVAQPIQYVNVNATGNNNGTSWADAFTTIQAALNVVPDNGELWIAQGTYTLTNRNASFTIPANKNAIKLYGGFDGTETNITQRNFRSNTTILSGDVLSDDGSSFSNRTDNAFNVIIVNGNNTVIDGLTVTGGTANSTSETFQQNGAAIRKQQTAESLTVQNCIIKDNFAVSSAAGIYAWSQQDETLIVTNSQFLNNRASLGTSIYAVTISGIPDYTIQILNNLFVGNQTLDINNGSGFAGSVCWLRAISQNSNINAEIINNTIYGNTDSSNSSSVIPANITPVGIEQSSGATIVTDFVNNIAKENRNTVTGNLNKLVSAVLSPNNGAPTITHNTSDANFANLTTGTSNNNSVVTASDILFTDETNSDFTLAQNSSAINSGNTAALSTSLVPTDLLGNSRVFSNTDIDRGAYESNSTLSTNNDYVNISYNLYPIPTTSILNIDTVSTITEIRIYTLTGKILKTIKNSKSINVSGLSSGIYFLKVENSNGEVSKLKFIKN